MLKSILGVIVGFIVMMIFCFAIFSGAYLALGAERAFESASYDASTIWMVIMVAVALITGLLGGLICAAISKSKATCQVFAGIVLALGLFSAVVTMMKEHPDSVRSGDVPIFEAMEKTQTPAWLCLLNPVLTAGGVLVGARKKLPAA